MGFGLGLKLGLGRGGGVPKFITDIFNLLQNSPTYLGGALTATDYLGNLVSSPADVPALEGGRLATTVAEGAMLGPELVVNGGFDTDTSWTKNAGWSIENGVAPKSPGVAGSIYQSPTLVQGRLYQHIFTVSGMTAGQVYQGIKGSLSAARTTNGTFTAYLVAGASGFVIDNYANSTFDGSIDNVSVREVIPTWYDTEADGSPIHPSVSLSTKAGSRKWYTEPFATPFGYSNWPARTNLFLNSNAPVTQNIATTAQAYTVSVLGTGTVTLTGTASGVASAGSPLTVTATAGTLTCTVAGGPSRVQVEAGAFRSPWVETLGATVTRAATNLTDPLTLAPQLQLVVIPAATSTAGTLMDDGTNKLSYNGTNLIFTDGTTTMSAAATLTAGAAYTIGVKGLAGDWALSVNGADIDTDTGSLVAWGTAKLGRNNADGDHFPGYFPNVGGYVGPSATWYKTMIGG